MINISDEYESLNKKYPAYAKNCLECVYADIKNNKCPRFGYTDVILYYKMCNGD